MSTPPAPPQQSHYYGASMPPIPAPNPEVIVYIVALLVVGIVALAAETVVAGHWIEFAKWVTAAYLISRGIAKLGKVLESR